MKTSISLTIFVAVFALNVLTAQTKIEKCQDFFIYKTESDFFNKKETLFGKREYMTQLVGNIYYYDVNKVFHKLINLSDSNIFGFKVEHIPEGIVVQKDEVLKPVTIQYIQVSKNYYAPFCGGNKDYFVTSALMGSGTFDADGFVNNDFTTYGNNSDYSTNYIEFWFHNKTKNISTKKIEDILIDDAALLEKYNLEQKETDKKVWRRYKYFIAIKYFKLYIKNHTK
jgi:hypothetical protein